MSTDERLERLERRVEVLESLLRARQREDAMAPLASAAKAPSAPVSMVAAAPSPASPPRPRSAAPRPSRIPDLTEQWIGQRGLLAVGVIALLMATGYLLKLSFERGWISPVMRCTGGALLGAVVGAIGWRLHQRYRTYGAALIGCGGGIVYLSVWAACRLYEVIPPTTGNVGLAMVSVALAMIAYAIDVEALGTTAALGAFMAPVLLGSNDANANLLLLYLASMAAGLGLVAARQGWRLAMFVVAASYFGVGIAGAAREAVPWALLLYGVIGGTAGLYVGLREQWWETRLLTFSGGWALLGAVSERMAAHWPVFVAGLILSAPVWWHALKNPRVLPIRVGARNSATPTGPSAAGWSAGEALYFFTTPLLLGWAAYGLAASRFDEAPGLLPLLVAGPYLAAGYLRPRPPFALVGAAAMAVAAQAQWDGSTEVWGLLALATLWPALDHGLARSDGRWYGVLTWGAAMQHLVGDALQQRPTADAAFVGPWALAMWGAIVAGLALAAGLFRAGPEEGEARLVRSGLWAFSGLLTLFGVTGEIRRYFELESPSRATADLAAGLAVSAWWLIFAAALVFVGFGRSIKPLRMSGLAVAGLAVIKVTFFDLSSLDALYRVGSVFLLGLVMLSLAYLYYRNDRSEPAP
ncbi:MAG: DUF2339 domain-containing protein [Gemmatimonadales bacterium]|nr:DUF2339 domain-containing protein [Gemmatimonadales bacterium]